ncbi:hypothetical protein AN958_04881 [Leucoagaricus sp. SymC.cos]|nr:hypothetical protein AN958_04881 [Leucoagaricus sp. SymC.cos]
MFHSLANCWRSNLHPTYRPLFSRFKSTYILRSPPKSAPRECPTPLVFVSAKAWDADSERGMTMLSSMLAERGFTCLQTDLTLPDPQTRSNSSSMMKWFEDELRSAIRMCMIPFPPVLFARSAGCLVAQTYISSNPASGLFMLSPPTGNAELESLRSRDDLSMLPTRLVEFDFEPYFPIAIMATLKHMDALKKSNRLVQVQQVDKILVDDLEGQQTFDHIQNWLDKLGI